MSTEASPSLTEGLLPLQERDSFVTLEIAYDERDLNSRDAYERLIEELEERITDGKDPAKALAFLKVPYRDGTGKVDESMQEEAARKEITATIDAASLLASPLRTLNRTLAEGIISGSGKKYDITKTKGQRNIVKALSAFYGNAREIDAGDTITEAQILRTAEKLAAYTLASHYEVTNDDGKRDNLIDALHDVAFNSYVQDDADLREQYQGHRKNLDKVFPDPESGKLDEPLRLLGRVAQAVGSFAVQRSTKIARITEFATRINQWRNKASTEQDQANVDTAIQDAAEAPTQSEGVTSDRTVSSLAELSAIMTQTANEGAAVAQRHTIPRHIPKHRKATRQEFTDMAQAAARKARASAETVKGHVETAKGYWDTAGRWTAVQGLTLATAANNFRYKKNEAVPAPTERNTQIGKYFNANAAAIAIGGAFIAIQYVKIRQGVGGGGHTEAAHAAGEWIDSPTPSPSLTPEASASPSLDVSPSPSPTPSLSESASLPPMGNDTASEKLAWKNAGSSPAPHPSPTPHASAETTLSPSQEARLEKDAARKAELSHTPRATAEATLSPQDEARLEKEEALKKVPKTAPSSPEAPSPKTHADARDDIALEKRWNREHQTPTPSTTTYPDTIKVGRYRGPEDSMLHRANARLDAEIKAHGGDPSKLSERQRSNARNQILGALARENGWKNASTYDPGEVKMKSFNTTARAAAENLTHTSPAPTIPTPDHTPTVKAPSHLNASVLPKNLDLSSTTIRPGATIGDVIDSIGIKEPASSAFEDAIHSRKIFSQLESAGLLYDRNPSPSIIEPGVAHAGRLNAAERTTLQDIYHRTVLELLDKEKSDSTS